MSRELHPRLRPAERRQLLLGGVELFNRGDFFAAHEAWEEIWRSTTPEPRDLFQGLIQVAVGLYHFLERRRPAPAARVMARGRRRLEPFAPSSQGLDLAALLAAVGRWEAWLAAAEGPPPPLPRIEAHMKEVHTEAESHTEASEDGPTPPSRSEPPADP